MYIATNATHCSGCRICELMCSFFHEGVFIPSKARLFVEINRSISVDTPPDKIDIPHVCIQCDPAPCAEICSSNAVVKDDKTGALLVNKDDCTGCGLCVDECQYGMIRVDEDKQIAEKCDLCQGNPQCVAFCPRGALVIA